MAEHVLGRRVRFWLAVVDWVDRQRFPEFVQRWALGRAARAVQYQAEQMNPDPTRRPF